VASTRAFDGLEGTYRRYRPDYPDRLLAVLREWVGPADGLESTLVLDVGAGTGISTRAIARALGDAFEYVGVEPNVPMRSEAVRVGGPPACRYVDGTAEALPFEDESARVVAAAQALQWFDRQDFYAEARRVLATDGVLAIVQNNRRWQDSSFLDRYERFLEEHSAGYNRDYRSFPIAEELAALSGFGPPLDVSETWIRPMSTDEFIGMSLSSTKMARAVQKLGEERAISILRSLAKEEGEELRIPYVTELYLSRRGTAR
jgi:SAM-dependent methyltransferase